MTCLKGQLAGNNDAVPRGVHCLYARMGCREPGPSVMNSSFVRGLIAIAEGMIDLLFFFPEEVFSISFERSMLYAGSFSSCFLFRSKA